MLGVGLVVWRRGGAREMIDVGELDAPATQPLRQIVDHVVLDEFEIGLMLEMAEVLCPSRLKIVDANHVRAFGDQSVAQVRTDEACTPRHKRNLLVPTLHSTLPGVGAVSLGSGGFFDVAFELGGAMRCRVAGQDLFPRSAANGGGIF